MKQGDRVDPSLSVVIPARNEEASIGHVVASLARLHPDAEILVVDDGSTDRTAEIARDAGARVFVHSYAKGNGAAIKSGAREARGEILIFMDGDGQHDPADVERLVAGVRNGSDMAVGARGNDSQASLGRALANSIYNRLASWIVGHRIVDLTSGFRAVRASRFREFLYLLPNGFSYPTTITMAFFRTGYTVTYQGIRARERKGDSHVSWLRDGVKFLLIIFKLCTLYSPLKIFFPVSVLQAVAGAGYYLYTYLEFQRFSDMSAVLMTGSLITFMFGLLSEQITALIFRRSD